MSGKLYGIFVRKLFLKTLTKQYLCFVGSKCWWHEQTDDGLLGAVIIIMALIYSTCVAIMYSEKKKDVGDLFLG